MQVGSSASTRLELLVERVGVLEVQLAAHARASQAFPSNWLDP